MAASNEISLPVISDVQFDESYCELKLALPASDTWGRVVENDVVYARSWAAMLAKARVKPLTMRSGRPAV